MISRNLTIAVPTWAFTAWWLATALATFARAQPAVQFPTAQPGASVYSPAPPTYATPGVVGPPPTFDSYTTGGVVPPPAAVPYNYAAPAQVAPASPWQSYPTAPGVPGYPQQAIPASPSAATVPFGWQQGSYSMPGTQGYVVQVQRFLQEIGFEHTWLYGDHSASDFEIHRLEIYSSFGIPTSYLADSPFLITPGFAVNYLEGPIGLASASGPELPPRVYDAYLDFAWYPQFTPVFGAELGVRTGVWSDFSHVNNDSVRFLGRALAKLGASPQLDILFGVVYLDRLRTKLLPAGGVYWRPNPNWDLYLVFPNPKIRNRFSTVGTSEWYWYVAGEYGGGSWTVNRSGFKGRADINDIRVSLGFEFETITQTRGHIELGYVFDREVIFADSSMTPTFKPDNTFMFRSGIEF